MGAKIEQDRGVWAYLRRAKEAGTKGIPCGTFAPFEIFQISEIVTIQPPPQNPEGILCL